MESFEMASQQAKWVFMRKKPCLHHWRGKKRLRDLLYVCKSHSTTIIKVFKFKKIIQWKSWPSQQLYPTRWWVTHSFRLQWTLFFAVLNFILWSINKEHHNLWVIKCQMRSGTHPLFRCSFAFSSPEDTQARAELWTVCQMVCTSQKLPDLLRLNRGHWRCWVGSLKPLSWQEPDQGEGNWATNQFNKVFRSLI